MNLDAMKELLSTVEAGGEIVFGEGGANCRRALADHWTDCVEAYREDDMNAALALHGALLPGWYWQLCTEVGNFTAETDCNANGGGVISAEAVRAPTPARALLIATLRGKIAQMEAEHVAAD